MPFVASWTSLISASVQSKGMSAFMGFFGRAPLARPIVSFLLLRSAPLGASFYSGAALMGAALPSFLRALARRAAFERCCRCLTRRSSALGQLASHRASAKPSRCGPELIASIGSFMNVLASHRICHRSRPQSLRAAAASYTQ